MKEDLLHFIWQSKLLMNQPFKTADGEVLQVVHPGMFNTDAGPDFFNAKVKIGDTLWAGNVEIHLKSSDWKNHRHQEDKKYNNVILHVVYQHDAEVFYDTGKPVPAFELKHVIPPAVLKNYQLLQQNQHTIACEKVFRIPPSPALVN